VGLKQKYAKELSILELYHFVLIGSIKKIFYCAKSINVAKSGKVNDIISDFFRFSIKNDLI